MAKTTTIHVLLPHEAIEVYAPVDAEHLHDEIYRILDCRNEDESVQFGKGTIVRCRFKKLMETTELEDTLVAYEQVFEH